MTHPDYQIVQLASLGTAFDEALADKYRVLALWNDACATEKLAAATDASLVITSVRKGLSRESIGHLPALRAVCSWGVGYETLDTEAMAERGIVVSNTPEILDDCVADLAWALLLTAARRTNIGDRYVKTGQWKTIGAFPLSTRVWGKRLGIVGLGRIGLAIAQRGTGFNMQVRYHNRRERPDSPFTFEPSLLKLAEWADFLVLACPGGPRTHHIVDAAVIRALGAKGILVNIARGTVVDEQALVAALENGEVGGAGLDVLEREPAVPEPFLHMDQVALMPHVGSATHETRHDMSRLVFDNAVSFLESGRLLTPIKE
ncbi:2-hydroxyacid dehydrogenase [Pollutimonas bauzanensis]|uniref:2-hydroxyacid dehydrogenase n=1 Tax=Pollutimonas bauzanensis TaxID=658167 RepID=UPI0033427B29